MLLGDALEKIPYWHYFAISVAADGMDIKHCLFFFLVVLGLNQRVVRLCMLGKNSTSATSPVFSLPLETGSCQVVQAALNFCFILSDMYMD